MPMTARQIMAKTPTSRRLAAKAYARIKEVKISNRPGQIYIRARTLTTHDHRDLKKVPPQPYEYVTTLSLDAKGYSIVSCSCEDFLYTWEYALAKKGRLESNTATGSLRWTEIRPC